MWKSEWKKGVDYPIWGDTEIYKKTISGGYLNQNSQTSFLIIYGKDGYA